MWEHGGAQGPELSSTSSVHRDIQHPLTEEFVLRSPSGASPEAAAVPHTAVQ